VKGRIWRCRNPICGFVGHRDVVGSVNMHPLAFGTNIAFPAQITYQRAGPVRVLARSEQPCPVGSQPARCRRLDTGHQEDVSPFGLVLSGSA
jgi:putative transposase